MIHFVEGDVLEAKEDILGHQVNCQGSMGKGLALQVRNKYPEAYFRYASMVNCMRDSRELLLGQCQLVHMEDGKYVANLFAQFYHGASKRQTNYKSLYGCLLKLKRIAETEGLSVALPYGIGCGLAGAEWGKVLMVIEKAFIDYDVTVYKLPEENELLLKEGM